MHRTRNLILALVLVAALALAAWLALRPAAEEPAPEEESSTLYSVDSGAITGLSWVWEGGTVALRREGGVWLCPQQPETAIDQSAAAGPVGRGPGRNCHLAEQNVRNPPLDVLQQRVRHRQDPGGPVLFGNPDGAVVPAQGIADGIEGPGRNAKVPFDGGKLPIYDHRPPPLLRGTEL